MCRLFVCTLVHMRCCAFEKCFYTCECVWVKWWSGERGQERGMEIEQMDSGRSVKEDYGPSNHHCTQKKSVHPHCFRGSRANVEQGWFKAHSPSPSFTPDSKLLLRVSGQRRQDKLSAGDSTRKGDWERVRINCKARLCMKAVRGFPGKRVKSVCIIESQRASLGTDVSVLHLFPLVSVCVIGRSCKCKKC